MQTIKTHLKVGAFYIAWEEDFTTSIRTENVPTRLPNVVSDYLPGTYIELC
jgi:hypothetical protein